MGAALADAAGLTARQVLTILGPIALLAALLHGIERALSGRLARRFGWKGVLITGWLGVPVHELSHALVCVLFGHRVEKMRLFAPDRRTGRLGYVRHAWNRHNPYQQAGRFFIGIAPLLGGAAALWVTTALFGPEGLRLPHLEPGAGLGQVAAAATGFARDLGSSVADGALARGGTWVYLYLCLCLGTHLAPSPDDLKGGLPGFVLLLVALFTTNTIVAWVGGTTLAGETAALSLAAPVLALLCLAVVLDLLCLALVWALTAWLPGR